MADVNPSRQYIASVTPGTLSRCGDLYGRLAAICMRGTVAVICMPLYGQVRCVAAHEWSVYRGLQKWWVHDAAECHAHCSHGEWQCCACGVALRLLFQF